MAAPTVQRPRVGAADKLTLSVAIVAPDKVTVLGLATLLRNEPRLSLSGTTSSDWESIAQSIGQSRPDVVLLDLAVGRPQQALQCCRRIREASPDTQVVAFTSVQEPGIVERAQDAGVLGIVARSSDPKELIRAVLFAGRGQPFVCTLLRHAPAVAELSARQEHILGLLADGMDTQAVAQALGVSPETVKSHVKVILSKLQARGRTHAVAIGMRRNIIG